MARKELTYVVTDEGRDKDKVYFITEMSASRAESWAMRILIALLGSNPEVPDSLADMGLAQLAEMGFRALGGLKWEIAEPLLAEMMTCVQIIPNPANPKIIRALQESDIEEVGTRLKLRVEIWKLHMDFFKDAAPFVSDKLAALLDQIGK